MEWTEGTLGDVIAEMRNGVNCKQDKSGIGDKITRIETIAAASFNLERVGYSNLPDKERKKYKLERGDILFSHINSAIHVEKTAIFDDEFEIYHGVNLMLLRPHDYLSSHFLNYHLKMIFQSGYWRTICKQSVNQASVNQKDIRRVPFKYPSLPEQQRIVADLDALAVETQHLEAIYQQIHKALVELKQSILQKAFNGEQTLQTFAA